MTGDTTLCPERVLVDPQPLDGSSAYFGERLADDWLVGVNPELEVGQPIPYRLELSRRGHLLVAGGHHTDRVAVIESIAAQAVLAARGSVIVLDPHGVYAAFRDVSPLVSVTDEVAEVHEWMRTQVSAAFAARNLDPGARPLLVGDLTPENAPVVGGLLRHLWLMHGSTLLSADTDTIGHLPPEALQGLEGRILLGDITPEEYARLVPDHCLSEVPHLKASARLRGHHVHGGWPAVEVQFAEVPDLTRWLLVCLRAGYTRDDAARLDANDPHVLASVEMMAALRTPRLPSVAHAI